MSVHLPFGSRRLGKSRLCKAGQRQSVVNVSALVLLILLSLFQSSPQQGVFPRINIQEVHRAEEALTRLPQALQAFNAGSYAEAEDEFGQILAQMPGEDSAAAAAALLGLKSSDDYTRLLSGLHANVGLCRFRARRYEQAVEAFHQAIATSSGVAIHRANLGAVLLRQQAYSEALEQLDRARMLGYGGADLHINLARAYFNIGNIPKARWAALQASRFARGEDALQSWGSMLEIDELLADIDRAYGLDSSAERRLRSVLARAPGAVSARYKLAQLLAREKRDSEAKEEQARFEHDSTVMSSVQTALASSPGRVGGLRWVADAYQRLGLLHMAELHYQQVLARNPGDTKTLSAIQRLRAQARGNRRQIK